MLRPIKYITGKNNMQCFASISDDINELIISIVNLIINYFKPERNKIQNYKITVQISAVLSNLKRII